MWKGKAVFIIRLNELSALDSKNAQWGRLGDSVNKSWDSSKVRGDSARFS